MLVLAVLGSSVDRGRAPRTATGFLEKARRRVVKNFDDLTRSGRSLARRLDDGNVMGLEGRPLAIRTCRGPAVRPGVRDPVPPLGSRSRDPRETPAGGGPPVVSRRSAIPSCHTRTVQRAISWNRRTKYVTKTSNSRLSLLLGVNPMVGAPAWGEPEGRFRVENTISRRTKSVHAAYTLKSLDPLVPRQAHRLCN